MRIEYRPRPTSPPAQQEGLREFDAETNIRAAIPAIEAYYADNGTYVGLSVELLQQYDGGVKGITFWGANDQWYCVESTVAGHTWRKEGPVSDIQSGHCPDTVPSP